MTPKKESLAERAARGEYDLILPLDQRIMEELPPDGTMLAGLYEIGVSAKEINKKYPAVRTASIATRLRLLREQGFVKQVKLVGMGPRGGTRSWQRTKLGDEWLSKIGGRDANG